MPESLGWKMKWKDATDGSGMRGRACGLQFTVQQIGLYGLTCG